MIRVMIADDHAVVRRGLRQILAQEPDIQVVGEAGSAAELIQQLNRTACDVVVLDITMPGRSGLDVLRELRDTRRDLAILVLSMHPEDQFAVRVLRSGASGYMTKETAPEELVKAIRKVRTGGRYISAAAAELLAQELEGPADRPAHEALSNREFEVLRLIAAGKTATEIADQLALSVKTVSTYRTRMLEKMRMTTNAELMRYALEHGLSD